MTIPVEVTLMVQALFPDNVAIREAPPGGGDKVNLSVYDAQKILNYLRGMGKSSAESLDNEEIPLEEIAEGVYAGMSKKTKVVYVRVTDG